MTISLQWRHMTTMASQITSLAVVHSIVYSGADQRKHQSSASLTGLCAGNSPGLVNSPHKGPVTRKMFPFDDVIMFLAHTIEMHVLWLKTVCSKCNLQCDSFIFKITAMMAFIITSSYIETISSSQAQMIHAYTEYCQLISYHSHFEQIHFKKEILDTLWN